MHNMLNLEQYRTYVLIYTLFVNVKASHEFFLWEVLFTYRPVPYRYGNKFREKNCQSPFVLLIMVGVFLYTGSVPVPYHN